MFDRLTPDARKVLLTAMHEARRLAHDAIATEHLMLALILEEGVIPEILRDCGIDPDHARKEIEARVGRGSSTESGSVPFTPRAKKVLERAYDEAQNLKKVDIGVELLFLAILGVSNSGVHEVFDALHVNAENLRIRTAAIINAESSSCSDKWDNTSGRMDASSRSNEFVVLGDEQKIRIRIGIRGSKEPTIILYDLDGVERAVLRLESDGGPVLELKGKDGSVIFRAPKLS